MGIVISSKHLKDGTDRQRIFNHTPRAGTTIHGKSAIAFGSAFLGMGIVIALAAAGVITSEGPSAPSWMIYCAAAVFAIPGLWVMGYGVFTLRRYQWITKRKHQFPREPWHYDYPWNERCSTYSDVKKIFQSMLVLSIVGGLGAIPAGLLWEAADGWILWVSVGFMSLFALAILSHQIKLISRCLRFGQSRIQFSRFPFTLGEKLQVVFEHPRGLKRGAPLQCQLRCVEDKFEDAGDDGQKVVSYSIYCETKEFGGDGLDGAGNETTITFDLPSGDYESTLREHPARYWELEITSEQTGVDYCGIFLLPVYGKGGVVEKTNIPKKENIKQAATKQVKDPFVTVHSQIESLAFAKAGHAED